MLLRKIYTSGKILKFAMAVDNVEHLWKAGGPQSVGLRD